MKLTDLAPSWASADGRHGQALSFRCPHCEERLVVPFANPLDGGAAPAWAKGVLWQREGDTFGTLTLTPSVDSPGHWHGFVTAGEVTTC